MRIKQGSINITVEIKNNSLYFVTPYSANARGKNN